MAACLAEVGRERENESVYIYQCNIIKSDRMKRLAVKFESDCHSMIYKQTNMICLAVFVLAATSFIKLRIVGKESAHVLELLNWQRHF